LFRNIYFSSESLRDHNWSDFFPDLRQDRELYIEAELRRGYADTAGPEPYFYSILPLTLTPASCASFLKSSTLPITARDYYLSKLFQFLYLPLEMKFPLEADASAVVERLVEFLDGITPDRLDRIAEFDWSQFYEDTLRYRLEDVLRRLPLHLPISKRLPCSEKMTPDRWVAEKWPRRLKEARGTDPQKVAAEICGVDVETYKKWEQGVRPPAPRNMVAVRRFTSQLNPET
jgi:hypothetical protein